MKNRPVRRRSAQVLYRTTPELQDELRRRAEEAGLTIQAYLDWALFGIDDTDLSVSDPASTREKGLPMTG